MENVFHRIISGLPLPVTHTRGGEVERAPTLMYHSEERILDGRAFFLRSDESKHEKVSHATKNTKHGCERYFFSLRSPGD